MTRHPTPAPLQTTPHPLVNGRLLQRQCTQCGQHTSGQEHCAECQKQPFGIQKKSIFSTTDITQIAIQTDRYNSSIKHLSKLTSPQPQQNFYQNFHQKNTRQDFSQIPTHSDQTAPSRLTIVSAGDRSEQEADRIADWIINRAMQPTVTMPTIQQRANFSLQRACKPCKEKLQRIATGTSEVTPAIETALSNLQHSGGQPLPLSIRQTMEPHFRHNFRHVRIHTNTQAAQLARSVQARAFTIGQDIVFGSDQFRPHTTAGKWLLAHELTHTLQQANHPDKISGALLQRVPASCTLDPDLPPQPSPAEFLEDQQINAIRESIFEAKPTVLKRGVSGAEVALIQRILLNHVCEGYDRDALRQEFADQVFGKVTRQAVKQFQQTYPDAIGQPLREDGIVGPYTLGAMDLLVDLEPIPPPSPTEGEGECYGMAEDGPGEFEMISEPTLLAWDLRNFDIAQHFVKTEHRVFLETEVIPQLQANLDTYRTDSSVVFGIIGQASATGSFAFNQALSERRAACVTDALIEKGLKFAPGDFDYISGIGKIPAEFKLIFKRASGKPLTKKDIEDREQRKVRIGIVFQKSSTECSDADKTNKSRNFVAKIACDTPQSARVNIADASGGKPIYREFLWTMFPTYTSSCQFSPSFIDPDQYQAVSALSELQLARQNPDDLKAPSDFEGEAVMRSDAAAPVPAIFADKRFSITFPGSWYPSDCEADFSGGIPDIKGWLTPIGPVKCGVMPVPPGGNCPLPEQDCDRTAGATRFTAYLTRGSFDVLPDGRLKRIIQVVVGAFTGDITVGLLAMGTLNAQGTEEINRVLVFVGPDIRRECEETGIQPIALGNTVDTGSKLFHLATEYPDYPTPKTDFWNLAATLKMLPGSNKDELAIDGFGTFTFVGPRCNDGARTISGRIFPLLPVFCGDISIPSIVRDIVELRPCDEDDCPDSHKTCADNQFTVKVGRADLADIPLYGRKLAEQYGCEVEAGFINIGTQNLDPPIYRQFFFVQKIGDCGFTVEPKTLTTRTPEPMKLATENPDQSVAPSDFWGLSQLSGAVWAWANIDKPAIVGLGLPGSWDANCGFFSRVSLLGSLLPIPFLPVECGKLPTPPHTPRNSKPDDCDRFKQTNQPKIENATERLRKGEFRATLSRIGEGVIILADTPLNKLRTGGVYHELAVGRNWENEPIVLFLDFEVLSVYRDATHINVTIKILSTPCAFSHSGQKVLFLRQNCQEGLRVNQIRILRSILELELEKQKQEEEEQPSYTFAQPPDQPSA